MRRPRPRAREYGWPSRARRAPGSACSLPPQDNMTGVTLRLKTALATRGHTEALKDGRVKPRTFEFDFEEGPVIIKAFRRMVRSQDFDICELAMTTYLCSREHGKPFTAIPVFPMRAFHHGAIVYNTHAGIRTPKDLEGKTVGVN